MQTVSEIEIMQKMCQSWRDKGKTIAFVPTMGCLHAGHLSLVQKAHSIADHVVVSIFVNPLQFGDSNDFLKYPSTLEEDVRKLADIGVSLVFTPDASTLYPEGENAVQQIELGEITNVLEGAHRPGHFSGVATVVKRLFDLINPTSAVFGEKDFQQLIVIKQLVEKFSLDIEIIGMPTCREIDGLAMSSRNLRLSKKDRVKASGIFRQLESVKLELDSGSGNLDFTKLENKACENLKSAGFIPEYVSICDIDTLLPAKNRGEAMVILAAAKLGEIRLIDNLKA